MALESFAVIMKPLAHAGIMTSIECPWDSLHSTCFPSSAVCCTPAFSAACCATSFILSKNGLLSVLVIRPTITSSPDAAAEPLGPPELDDPPPPHAARTRQADRPVAIRAARRPRGEMGFRTMEPLVFVDRGAAG